MHRHHRRQFLAGTAATALAGSLPLIVPHRVLGQNPPSDQLRMASIGVGRMGLGDMKACAIAGLDAGCHARMVAVCDLDQQRVQHAQRELQQFYAERTPDEPAPTIDGYTDYRELLARDDIDGVTISTPDHWHALLAVAAAEAGKGIYLQKPLTYTLAEGQALVRAVRRNQVVLQTGSQQRSEQQFRRACELVRNGRVGRLQTIQVTLPKDHGTGRDRPMPVPEHFNYAMWLGPRPEARYTEDRVHPQEGYGRPGWLQIESFSRGMITGWGAHMFDIAQWGHGSDDSGPVAIEATAEFPARGLFDVHTDFQATGRYADGVQLLASSGDPAGVRFEGDAGSIFVRRGQLQATPEEILQDPLEDAEVQLYRSDHHMQNFLQCLRSGKDPVCPVEIGHRSNSICIITHIAMKLGRPLQWDPQAEQFTNDDQANALLDYEHRSPWLL